LETFLEQQHKRIHFLEFALNDCNEGRSKSFYCLASALLSVTVLECSETTAKQKITKEKVRNIKEKSKLLKDLLKKGAREAGVELKLRKK
jgi:hypothetical protein